MSEIAARLPDTSPLTSVIGTIGQTVKRVVAAHARWRMRRKTARILGGLSDDMLKDLGLTRSDLRAYEGKEGGLSDDMLKDLGLTRSDLRAYEGKDNIRNWRTIDRWR